MYCIIPRECKISCLFAYDQSLISNCASRTDVFITEMLTRIDLKIDSDEGTNLEDCCYWYTETLAQSLS